MRIKLLTHLLEYGALCFDRQNRLFVTDTVLLWEALGLIGIRTVTDLTVYLKRN